MFKMWGAVALTLALSSPSAAAGRCPVSPDLAALPREVDRIAGPLVLAPMYCSNAREGIYCIADDATPTVLLTGMFLGNRTSVKMAEAVLHCVPGQKSADCRFAVDADLTMVEAGRRADRPGWAMVTMKAGRIDLLPIKCPE